MKQKATHWYITIICMVFGMFLVPVLLPAAANAAGGKQVDACISSDPANACNAFIDKYINPAVKALSALVGIAAVGSIIFAGIQYSSSADDPGVVTKAKQRIFNVVIGLVAYIFLIAFLNYLVPGGIF